MRSLMGDARGRWEGNTLVVETTNFRERTAYRQANQETLTLVERFTRTAPDVVEWTVTVADHEPVLEYACHEGNYAMHNMLSGARSDEREAAQAAAK